MLNIPSTINPDAYIRLDNENTMYIWLKILYEYAQISSDHNMKISLFTFSLKRR